MTPLPGSLPGLLRLRTSFASFPSPENLRAMLAKQYPEGTEFTIVLNAKGTGYDVTADAPIKAITVTITIPEERAMLTAEELKVIEERCKEATEGPWRISDGSPPVGLQVCETDTWEYVVSDCDDSKGTDAPFIAAARTDVPRLLADVRRLQAILDCETGKRAPEGWAWFARDDVRGWRKMGWEVYRMDGEPGVRVLFEGCSLPAADLLSGIEDAEKAMVGE